MQCPLFCLYLLAFLIPKFATSLPSVPLVNTTVSNDVFNLVAYLGLQRLQVAIPGSALAYTAASLPSEDPSTDPQRFSRITTVVFDRLRTQFYKLSTVDFGRTWSPIFRQEMPRAIAPFQPSAGRPFLDPVSFVAFELAHKAGFAGPWQEVAYYSPIARWHTEDWYYMFVRFHMQDVREGIFVSAFHGKAIRGRDIVPSGSGDSELEEVLASTRVT